MNRKLIYVCVILLFLFIFIFLNSSTGGFLERLDLSVNQSISGIWNSFFSFTANLIGILFDTISLVVVSLIIALFLWIKKYKKEAYLFAGVMIISSAIIYTIKEIVQRARPLNSLVAETGFSFPSGHSTIAAVFFGLLCYLIFRSGKSLKFKVWTGGLSVLAVLIIGFSRIYLSVHWVSDVLGGFVLGSLILFLGILVYELFD